jgi:hypothetical protein
MNNKTIKIFKKYSLLWLIARLSSSKSSQILLAGRMEGLRESPSLSGWMIHNNPFEVERDRDPNPIYLLPFIFPIWLRRK